MGSGLTTAKILATLELMGTLRIVIYYLGISFGFYYEVKIIFGRFCTILNIKDKRMAKIDSNTKLPLVESNVELKTALTGSQANLL